MNVLCTFIFFGFLGQTIEPVGFVVWEPHSEREHTFVKVVCCVSYRPISTGQLHESLVLASTSGLSTQWSSWGPLTLTCMEISSRSGLPA